MRLSPGYNLVNLGNQQLLEDATSSITVFFYLTTEARLLILFGENTWFHDYSDNHSEQLSNTFEPFLNLS